MNAPSPPHFYRCKSWPPTLALTDSKKISQYDSQSVGVSQQHTGESKKQQQQQQQQQQKESKRKGWKVRIRKFREAFHIKGHSIPAYNDGATLTIGEVKTVTFGKVEVRQHARILSDHPACSDGLALGLDWQHCERATVMDIDLYERRRRQEGRHVSNSLRKLSAEKRCQLLLYIGCVDENEIRRVYTRPREAIAA